MKSRFPELTEVQKKFITENHDRLAIYKMAKLQGTCSRMVKEFLIANNLPYRTLGPRVKKRTESIGQFFNYYHPGYWLIG